MSGGSAANLSALAVAREVAKRKSAVPAGGGGPIVGSDAHSSVGNTLRLLEMDALVVPTAGSPADRRRGPRSDRRPTATRARWRPSWPPRAPPTPASSTTWPASRRSRRSAYDLWFHVDGAYGGAGLFAPSVRAAYDGIEHADSFVVDPHKWLFAPYDCAALLYRDPALARSVHKQDAGYLDVIHEQPAEWNPTDYAYHLTRRARGLPLWFSLAVHGVNAYSAAIESAIDLARQTAAEISARDYLELIREPDLSVVLFRRIGWQAADYAAWADKLLDDQVAFVPPTPWDGETVARLAFLHPQTPMELVKEILERMAGPG